jgi:hypothetical protein
VNIDKDDSGSITYDEFLVGIRGVLNARRRELVHMAFDVIDKDGSGIITVDDIRDVYNVSGHPEVIAGTKKPEQVLLELLDNFDVGGTKDGQVTIGEFENYYANVSASIDSDDYFELMMRNAWHISGGEGWCANTTNKRVLVTHADGRQTVEEVKNDLGLAAKDKVGLVARLRAQGINAAAVNTSGSAGMDQDADPFARKPNQAPGQQRQQQQQPQPQQQQQARPGMPQQPPQRPQQPIRPQQQQQQYQQQQFQPQQTQQRPSSAAAGGRPRPMSLTATMNGGSVASQESRPSQDSRYSRGSQR